jgi:hypothetical protein
MYSHKRPTECESRIPVCLTATADSCAGSVGYGVNSISSAVAPPKLSRKSWTNYRIPWMLRTIALYKISRSRTGNMRTYSFIVSQSERQQTPTPSNVANEVWPKFGIAPERGPHARL